MDTHASDCAVHNAPALPAGPCDCEAWWVCVDCGEPRPRKIAVGWCLDQDSGAWFCPACADRRYPAAGN